MWRKLKLNFQPAQYKKKFDKDNFEKKHVVKHCSKTKIMWGNIVTIYSILKKKITKQNQQRLF
jgi:hypothetical protein